MTKPGGPLWRFGAATMALATALAVVAACGSEADKSDAPAAAGSHSAHAGGSSASPRPLRAGERFVDLKMAEAYTPAPPEGGGTDEYRCQVIDPGLTKAAFLISSIRSNRRWAVDAHEEHSAADRLNAALLRRAGTRRGGGRCAPASHPGGRHR